jgi:hypothetical protein
MRRRLGEGSWVADDFGWLPLPQPFFVWVEANGGSVLRYLDRDYQLRVR